MTKTNGIHHLAVATADIKQQIEFFTDVMGMELIALYWMHGVEGAWHGFLGLNENSALAFVQTPDIGNIEPTIGVTHAGNGGAPCAPGTMQHLAFNVDTREELLEMRDRIRSHGVHVFGEIDHGFCRSIYFAGLENLTLEVSTFDGAGINPAAWIDPEVVKLAGISESELARYKSPPKWTRPSEPVAQPVESRDKPEMAYPKEIYDLMLAATDEMIFEQGSETEPPIKVAG